jgi:hypothetical protein
VHNPSELADIAVEQFARRWFWFTLRSFLRDFFRRKAAPLERITAAKPLFLWNRRDAPGTVADFDATQFFPRFHIDDGDVV